jgi:hypothetical protein
MNTTNSSNSSIAMAFVGNSSSSNHANSNVKKDTWHMAQMGAIALPQTQMSATTSTSPLLSSLDPVNSSSISTSCGMMVILQVASEVWRIKLLVRWGE